MRTVRDRLFDCFLYNGESELAEIRLQLLQDVVDVFVIVTSDETFTGAPRHTAPFPPSALRSVDSRKVRLVHLPHLRGGSPWSREAFSRDSFLRGLFDAAATDWVLVSDVDEIPRPEALRAVKTSDRLGPLVLDLDYFNFRFNYKLVHGLQATWAGPVLYRFGEFPGGQKSREQRWRLLEHPETCVPRAGWHFSYLTPTDDVSAKLRAFSHQEVAIQSRAAAKVSALIAERSGFHDHLHAGSVWAVVDVDSYECDELARLVRSFSSLMAPGPADDASSVSAAIRSSMRTLYHHELAKLAGWFGWKDLTKELMMRARHRLAIRR
jgi:beta-1,4-mannosyl-glycoprotein beta-1,4-N-acetylglucosaminyltransferase